VTLSRGWWQRPDGSAELHYVALETAGELTVAEAHALGRALLALDFPA
jgi:hypothetical protein